MRFLRRASRAPSPARSSIAPALLVVDESRSVLRDSASQRSGFSRRAACRVGRLPKGRAASFRVRPTDAALREVARRIRGWELRESCGEAGAR